MGKSASSINALHPSKNAIRSPSNIEATLTELLKEKVVPAIEAFLAERGLELSLEKSRITDIRTGFDFLGATLRKMGGKLLMTPSRKSVKAFLDGIRETIRTHAGSSIEKLISLLNPRIRGWAFYFSNLVSSRVFHRVDKAIFDTMVRWMRRRHPERGMPWLRKRYFRSNGSRRWIITASPGKAPGRARPGDLFQAADVPIRRHVKVRATVAAFDPAHQDYLRQRRKSTKRGATRKREVSSTNTLTRRPRPGHVAILCRAVHANIFTATGKVMRTDDLTRVMDLLGDYPSGLSNQRVRSTLRMGRDRYEHARQELLARGDIEKYVCRGGGIRLTQKGESAAPSRFPGTQAVVRQSSGEARLYPILVDQLFRETDDGVLAHHFSPASLRRQGKWRNPDVATIGVEVYPRLQRIEVVVLTYEVKPWGRWDASAVFEAESQGRGFYGSTLVVEWPDGRTANLEDRELGELVRECRHHRVSLAALESENGAYRLNWLYTSEVPPTPVPGEMEEWLEYVLPRMPDVAAKLDEFLRIGRDRLRKPR